jgi:hypothetical protein
VQEQEPGQQRQERVQEHRSLRSNDRSGCRSRSLRSCDDGRGERWWGQDDDGKRGTCCESQTSR